MRYVATAPLSLVTGRDEAFSLRVSTTPARLALLSQRLGGSFSGSCGMQSAVRPPVIAACTMHRAN